MFNSLDAKQVRSLIEYRREQVAADARRVQKAAEGQQPQERRAKRIRVAIGARLIRAGARIAGMYPHELPHLRLGI